MRIDFEQLDTQPQPQQPQPQPPFDTQIPQIWKNPFLKEKEIAKQQEESEDSYSFSVNYPYEVRRSVSPSAINKELAYLQAKKILPTSTLRFIQTALSSELEKNASAEKSRIQSQQSFYQSPDKSPYLQQTMRTQETLNQTLKNTSHANLQRQLRSVKNSKKQLYNHIKPKVYDKKKVNVQQYNRRKEPQLDGVTLKPILNFTMNSKTAKKVHKKRDHRFKTYNTDVFQSLYNDSAIYTSKRQLDKTLALKQSKCTRRSSKIKVYSTFEERLQTSIEKQAMRRKKAQNKLEVDLSTGKRFFIPDISKSRLTYLTHFKSANSLVCFQSQIYPARANHYSRDSQKFSHSQELASTLNNSFERDLNKSLDSKNTLRRRKPLEKENKLAELYADLLWSESDLKEEVLNKQEKSILNGFLQEIRNYQHEYSNSINRQVFVAFFKQIYTNMNLFDRAILDQRLKKTKIEAQAKKQLEKTTQSKISLTDRKNSRLRLDHTYKHFFI